ncbi:MAG: molybdate ABC transporter substrate-binding protein [Rhodobacteraceae bacterium]|nr:molybdate ABC transporter substrate-binding protein [Paracoccaceae bacterium]
MRRILLAAAVACACATGAAAGQITVFAAASLKTVLDEMIALYAADPAWGGAPNAAARVVPVLAGSSILARQIQRGAPADVFISANPGWMDALERDGLLAEGSRRNLVSNRLVLIVPAAAATDLRLPDLDLGVCPGPGGRMAMALVDAVPAGIYGKAALQALGLWPTLRDRIAQADNVRAALALVALGESPCGIVYATDAQAEPRVAVAAGFPADSHPPIVYPAAVIAGRDTPQARHFLAFLAGPEARAVFARHGFAAALP